MLRLLQRVPSVGAFAFLSSRQVQAVFHLDEVVSLELCLVGLLQTMQILSGIVSGHLSKLQNKRFVELDAVVFLR
jgi:hypothetical protein